MNGAMGGSATPDMPPNRFAISEFRLALDLENDRMRLQQVRTAQFVFANATVVRQDQRLDGDVAFNVAVGQGGPQRASDATARARRLQMLEHPLVLVQAALEPGATASNLRDEHGEPHVDITTAAGETVTLGVDPETGLPSHVSRREYDSGWGDVVIETVFADYETIEGVAVPTRVTTTTDEWLTADITLTEVQVDVEVEDLAAPVSVRNAPAPAPPPVNVTVDALGQGIWWLAGGSHHSVLFEFDDHLVLFEVPLNDARTLAVIERAREIVPDKPLTHAIVSHHHLDHAGGFRAAVSEGLTIVTHRENEAFLRDIASRPHTIEQDALARNPREPEFLLIDDELELSDDTNEVIIYKGEGNEHAGVLLFAWVPRDRLVVQGDFYSVGYLAQPYGAAFLQNLAAHNLSPARHAPIHGELQSHDEVLEVLATAPTEPPTE